MAQEPQGLRTLAKGFPGLQTASQWSQALEDLERNSRPYLQEVQRYETYRYMVPANRRARVDGGRGQVRVDGAALSSLSPISSPPLICLGALSLAESGLLTLGVFGSLPGRGTPGVLDYPQHASQSCPMLWSAASLLSDPAPSLTGGLWAVCCVPSSCS